MNNGVTINKAGEERRECVDCGAGDNAPEPGSLRWKTVVGWINKRVGLCPVTVQCTDLGWCVLVEDDTERPIRPPAALRCSAKQAAAWCYARAVTIVLGDK